MKHFWRLLSAIITLALLSVSPAPLCSAADWGQVFFDDAYVAQSEAPVIDLMVLYSYQAFATNPNLTTKIDQSVDKLNEILLRSQINASFNLVYAGQVKHSQDRDFEALLDGMENDGDGVMDEVHAWRDAYGADLVSLWVDGHDQGGSTGLGFTLDPESYAEGPAAASQLGFNVIDYNSIDNLNVWAHELGHNLGADHEEYQGAKDGGNKGVFPYSMGYVDIPYAFATVMAYGTQLEDLGHKDKDIDFIPYYSNPDIYYRGQTTGNARNADVARTFNQTVSFVAQYR